MGDAMTWDTEYKYIPQYEYTSCNQHGNRYKRLKNKRVIVSIMSAKTGDAADIQTLVLMSHGLNVPVHYDFNDNTAYIKVVSEEVL
jgi:hypothetical protein